MERIVWEAARHLAPRHEVMVVARTVEELPEGVTHVPVAPSRLPGPLAPATFGPAAARALAGRDAEVVVAYGNECPPADVFVVNSVHRAWLARSGPVVFHDHRLPQGTRYVMPHHLVALALERRAVRWARRSYLVPAAAHVGHDLERLYGLRGTGITVVHNGFSPSEFSPERRAELRAAVRAELGYGPDDVVLLMVANEWRRKGLPVVLEALHQLADPSAALLLVGRSAPDAFVAPWAATPAGPRVRYLGSTSDVGRLHAAADLFVMPTEYEAFSLAVIEALGSGLPVLTTDVPGAGDAVVDGVNGALQRDPHDPAELARLLRRGLDPEVRAAWSAAAPGTVTEYRWDRLMARFEAVLTAVHQAGRR